VSTSGAPPHVHAHGLGAHLRGNAFAIGIALNVAFLLTELVYGVLAHSMALVADAAHNASDVAGLFLAWGASILARRKPSPRRTYGLRRSTILAALANALLLLVAVGIVSWEAIGRLQAGVVPNGMTILVVSAIGVVINGASALLFLRDRKGDVNVRAAFMHLAADAAVSLAVVVAGLAIITTGWSWLDPAISLAVSAVILAGTWAVLQEAMNLALDAVPEHVDPQAIHAELASHAGVLEVHDLHIWAMSTTDVALTAHLVVVGCQCRSGLVREVTQALAERFHIAHATIQLELADLVEPKRLLPRASREPR